MYFIARNVWRDQRRDQIAITSKVRERINHASQQINSGAEFLLFVFLPRGHEAFHGGILKSEVKRESGVVIAEGERVLCVGKEE